MDQSTPTSEPVETEPQGDRPGDIHTVAERLSEVEARLERILASGWRGAGEEAASLTAEADQFGDLGLSEMANRLRAVATARTAREGLAGITLAVSASRLLRLRIPGDALAPGAWAPFGVATKRRSPSADRILPIARIAMPDGERWSCVRLRGALADEWLLLDPIGQPPLQPDDSIRPPDDPSRPVGDPAGSGPWLRQIVEGQLRWRARYPLGASGEVQRCKLIDPVWLPIAGAEDDRSAPYRKVLTDGDFTSGLSSYHVGTFLKIRMLDPDDADVYVWPDPSVATLFNSLLRETSWGIVWADGALVTPLALLETMDAAGEARVVHLVDRLVLHSTERA